MLLVLIFSLLGLIWQAIVGLIIGALAKLIMPGRDPGGIFVTAIIGMIGSVIGTFLGQFLFGRNYTAGWIMSIIGALIVLAIYRALARPRAVI